MSGHAKYQRLEERLASEVRQLMHIAKGDSDPPKMLGLLKDIESDIRALWLLASELREQHRKDLRAAERRAAAERARVQRHHDEHPGMIMDISQMSNLGRTDTRRR